MPKESLLLLLFFCVLHHVTFLYNFRLKGKLGLFLALTGYRLKGIRGLHAHFIT